MKYLKDRVKILTSGGMSLFLALTVLSVSALAAGTNITLDFNSLPSTQGWVYLNDGTGVPEAEVFSVNGTELHQDTINTSAGEFNFWFYELSNVVDPTLPFILEVRARITAEEHPASNNICGFCFYVDTGSELFGFGLSAAPRVADIFEVTVSTIDTSQYHDYRIEATPGVGWDFYIDNALVASGPPRTAGAGSNALRFGDLTRGPNAIGDIESYSFVQLPATIIVEIDVKPGSEPNCFNNNGHGVIPVAILSSSSFDATQVDPSTVSLDGQGVRVAGKSNKQQAHQEDANNDGRIDLVVQIEDVDGSYEEGDTIATLTGETFDGTPIEGTDTLCIVP